MRLDLLRYNCVHFGIQSDFTVPKDNVAINSLMDQTLGHSIQIDQDPVRVATFGSRSRIGGNTYQILGILRCITKKDDANAIRLSITVDKALDSLPRPPSGMRPISRLVDSATDLFGSVEVSCTCSFKFDEQQEYRSKVNFPMPLIVQDSSIGITHIEQAEFSRRINDDVEYRVTVSQDATSFGHLVEFDRAMQLNRGSIKRLFDDARSISSLLLIRTGGENG